MNTTITLPKPFNLSIFSIIFLTLTVFSFTSTLQAQEVSQTFYFTGNTGTQETPYTKKVLSAITEMSQKDNKATFVALGNITTKKGFPTNKKKRLIDFNYL